MSKVYTVESDEKTVEFAESLGLGKPNGVTEALYFIYSDGYKLDWTLKECEAQLRQERLSRESLGGPLNLICHDHEGNIVRD